MKNSKKRFDNIQKDSKRRTFLLKKKWSEEKPGYGLSDREERELEDLQEVLGEFLKVVDPESFIFHKDFKARYVRSRVLYDTNTNIYYEVGKDLDGNIVFAVSNGYNYNEINPTYADLYKFSELLFEKLEEISGNKS